MPDFPSELVEAAAILLEGGTCERCDGEGYVEIHDPSAAHAGNPDGSHDEYCPDCCGSGRAAFEKAARLIEQRVIDRLAREAGSNPYTPAPAARHYDAQSDDVIRESAWSEGAACGVAAERERCPLCNHEWRRHDPEDGRCDCHSETIIGPCQCGRDLAWMQERIAAMSNDALSALPPASPATGDGDE